MHNTIIVTGGAGYIGSITTKELAKLGWRVVVVDNLENGHKDAVNTKAKLEIADIGNRKKMAGILDKYRPSAVIDFAAYLAVGESMIEPRKYFENNVANFINLLDAMIEAGCKNIIKSSTAATYGNPLNEEDFPLIENYTDNFEPDESNLLQGEFDGIKTKGEEYFQKFIHLYDSLIKDRQELKLTEKEITTLRIPTSIYGLSKLLDEIIMKKYDKQFGLKSITLRYFNVAGADITGLLGEDKASPTNLMTVTIYKALGKRDKLEIFGNDYPTKDGTGVRDYIHVIDLAVGHIKALEYLLEKRISNTFNLGTGKGFSVYEVISAVEKAAGREISYIVSKRRSGDPAVSISNPNKANSILGWKTSYSLKDMAETAWKWHNSHPNGYNK